MGTEGSGGSGVPRVDHRRNTARILEAAARLLADDPGVTMQAIADAAGLSRLTVYRHYPSRAVLQVSLRAAVLEQALAALDAFPGWEHGADAFRVFVRSMTALVRRYPVILMRHRVAGEQEGAFPVDNRIAELFSAGQQTGVLRSDLSPHVLNATLFAVLSAHTRLRPAADDDDVADGVADLLLRGMAAPGES